MTRRCCGCDCGPGWCSCGGCCTPPVPPAQNTTHPATGATEPGQQPRDGRCEPDRQLNPGE
jgi:hypothetical protein